MKVLLSIAFIWMAFPVFAQAYSLTSIKRDSNVVVNAEIITDDLVFTSPEQLLVTFGLDDTLSTERRFIKTIVKKDGRQLSNSTVLEKLQSVPNALTNYRWGNILKPSGPILSVLGAVIMYDGIKGTKAWGMVRGQRTSANPNPPNVQVEYTKRNLPQILGGLGLFIGGIGLIELSNELTIKSIRMYNLRVSSQKKISGIVNLKLGLTSTGNCGLEAHF